MLKRFVLFLSLFLSTLPAAVVTGNVLDPSGAPIYGAKLLVTSGLRTVQEAGSDTGGSFRLDLGDTARFQLVITATGFKRKTIVLDSISSGQQLTIGLELAPVNDSITVTGSIIPAPLSQQGSSVTVISRAEIEQRNEASALDLLRDVPGVVVNQSGQRGSTASLFVRGGETSYNLVLIDGVPVNEMRIGGFVDFAHIPTDFLERIEVSRGAQSAVYGSYANSSVIRFVTRLDDSPLHMNLLAEGGSFSTRRFAIGGAGSIAGFRASARGSRLDTGGESANSDYRNESVSLNLGRRFHRQDLSFRGYFDSSENGVPGAYGSNPVGNFSGLDRISRNKNNTSTYQIHYELNPSPRVRQEVLGTFFLNNNFYKSRFGGSFNKDLRAMGDARTTIAVTPRYTIAFGLAYTREEVKNTFITDNSFRKFPLRRDQEGIYFENRFQPGAKFFLNAGVRTEVFETPAIPGSSTSQRPDLPDRTAAKVNPKVAAGYVISPGTRIHASFGTGIRPPGGFDLAFTNNPALKPERTIGVDAGIEQRLGKLLSLDATYFYNRYSDLIVSLGGSLARLGSYRSDNLSNARSQGAEFSANLRPNARILLSGNYTLLQTELLSLDGASGVAPLYYRVGQRLARRPTHSGNLGSSFSHKRLSANVTAHFRGETLDVEPNFGAFSGFFANPGFTSLGVNLNLAMGSGVTIYGNLRNALNEHYEEIYGYPSPRLNFVAGIKWRWPRD